MVHRASRHSNPSCTLHSPCSVQTEQGFCFFYSATGRGLVFSCISHSAIFSSPWVSHSATISSWSLNCVKEFLPSKKAMASAVSASRRLFRRVLRGIISNPCCFVMREHDSRWVVLSLRSIARERVLQKQSLMLPRRSPPDASLARPIYQ
jgi:hypothetical protein